VEITSACTANRRRVSKSLKIFTFFAAPLLAWSALAQINVITQHYDVARTGANTSETVLTPANVNFREFGKLFAHSVSGYVYAQPLYVAGLTLNATKHNVVFIATEGDNVYAFDADSDSGSTAFPLWHITLLDTPHGAAAGATTVPSSFVHSPDIVPQIGITSTPVIDPATFTMYLVGATKENNAVVLRLHALDIRTGLEKFGGPVKIVASVPGNGGGSFAGFVHFDPVHQFQRPGLLLLHGIVYLGFGSNNDQTPYHGWILGYNAATLRQTGAWCTTPNGEGGGIWHGGVGLAADVPDPVGHPYGRLFVATGNGSYDAVAPNYNNSMNYGDSVIRLDLTNGVPSMVLNGKTVGSIFTPHNQAQLSPSNQDQGSGGILLLPNSASGGQHLMVQAGKSGGAYILNQENLGGYHPNDTVDPEREATLRPIFGAPAYWSGHLFFWAAAEHLRAFPFVNGIMSSTSSSISAEYSGFPGSTPVVSANDNSNGIVWNIRSDAFATQGREILYAHAASNVSTMLYSSEQDIARDNPGAAVKFVVPVVANGKVYVGAENQISVYGLLNGAAQAAAPVINPASESFRTSLTVTMSDSSTGASIHYTTDGSTPDAASPTYTGPIAVTRTTTISAIATGSRLLASSVSRATYTLVTQVATPSFKPAPGAYTGPQSVAISTVTAGATIYYTTNGVAPTTSSAKYNGPITISSDTALKAFATAPGLTNSATASGNYTIRAFAPSFSPAPGTYSSAQTVTLSTKTSGATIYYTTNGTAPTTSSTKYTGPFTLKSTTTVEAFAVAPNHANSTVTSATYTIP
jgi:Chitobiase/beta-hexosaminidase C-terminal domain